jgi:hypothetical protein
MIFGQTQTPVELAFTAARPYRDIFNEVEVDVVFQAPGGAEMRVPAFWAGGSVFRVRYASAEPGRHSFRTLCSNPDDAGLHGQSGELVLAPYGGGHALYSHGRLRVAASRRTLEWADGTPFFWLADTWWYAFTQRLDWPTGARALIQDRVNKGFTVAQVVAGPPCDIDADVAPFDPQYGNEGGLPWEEGWSRLNPRYYDMVDLKIAYMIEAGLVPCVLGCWGYFLLALGLPKMKQHWRNLVARYGAYPVVWCLAGETTLPTYSHWMAPGTASLPREEMAQLAAGWTEVGQYVRALDPYRNLLCTHPWPATSTSGRKALLDEGVVDFDMLQTGHGGYESLEFTLQAVGAALTQTPRMPVIDGEVNYEGIMGGSGAEVQRFVFWTCITAGAAGHTYGANGLWQMNSRNHEPHRGYTPNWGDGFWQDAMCLPGSTQVGLGHKFLARYPWWLFEPRSEPALPADHLSAFATGIPGAVALYYRPIGGIARKLMGISPDGYGFRPARLTVELGTHYRAFYLNPRTGAEIALGGVTPEPDGGWTVPTKPTMEDWVLVLEDPEALARIAGRAPV